MQFVFTKHTVKIDVEEFNEACAEIKNLVHRSKNAKVEKETIKSIAAKHSFLMQQLQESIDN